MIWCSANPKICVLFTRHQFTEWACWLQTFVIHSGVWSRPMKNEMVSKFLFSIKIVTYMTKFKLHLCKECNKFHQVLLSFPSPCVPLQAETHLQHRASAFRRQNMKKCHGRQKRNFTCCSFCFWLVVSAFLRNEQTYTKQEPVTILCLKTEAPRMSVFFFVAQLDSGVLCDTSLNLTLCCMLNG